MHLDYDAILAHLAYTLLCRLVCYSRQQIESNYSPAFPPELSRRERNKHLLDILRVNVKRGVFRVVDAMLPSPVVGVRPIFISLQGDGVPDVGPIMDQHRQRLPAVPELRETKLYLATDRTYGVVENLPICRVFRCVPPDLGLLHERIDAALDNAKGGDNSYLVAQLNLSQVYLDRSRAYSPPFGGEWMRVIDKDYLPPAFPLAVWNGTEVIFGGSVGPGFVEDVHIPIRTSSFKTCRHGYEIW